MTSRKLRHYFEAYQVSVVTEFPLADILHNSEATGRIAKWATELRALHLNFKPNRHQVTSSGRLHGRMEGKSNPTPANKLEHWTMYFDGSLKLDKGGAGILFISPK